MENRLYTFFKASILMIPFYPSAHHYQIYHAVELCNAITVCNINAKVRWTHLLMGLWQNYNIYMILPKPRKKMPYYANNTPYILLYFGSNYDIYSNNKKQSWLLVEVQKFP